jgi:3-keto-disaccharide hydrolase
MKQLCLFLTAAAAFLTAAAQPHEPFLGRWDVTVTTATATYPDWLNVELKDGHLSGTIQPRSGSAFAVDDLKKDGPNHLVIKAKQATWDLTLNGDQFTGSIKQGDAAQGKLAGVRAPALKRPMPKAWTDPEPIFNGKDLSGWEPMAPANSHWVVKNGELVNEDHGSNLKTTRKFDDFKLHIEYNCPDKGNSGIYLRGRYEVQVEYEPIDANDKLHSIGSVYSFLSPQVELPRKPGTWESFDITLVGRFVTIVRNGTKTMDNLEIPGPTGGALDSREGEPGPFYIQGDHTGGLKYRNITISEPKK